MSVTTAKFPAGHRFSAEPWNLPFTAEFPRFCGIL